MPFDPVFTRASYAPPALLPSSISALGPRQREIASIIYRKTSATPNEVQSLLSDPCSIRAIRTLLDRMVARGLVKRGRSGRHRGIVYLAAIPTPQVKEAAMRRLVKERFDGSWFEAATAIASLAKGKRTVPRTPAEVRQGICGSITGL